MRKVTMLLMIVSGMAVSGIGIRAGAAEPAISGRVSEGLNLDFRNGTDGWDGVDGKLWRLSATAISRGQALQRVLYPGTPASTKPFEAYFAKQLPVVPGKAWLVEGYVTAGDKWDPNLKMALHLTFLDAAGKEIGQFETEPRSSLVSPHLKYYSRISGKTKVPETAVTAKLSARVYVEALVGSIRYVTFDNLWVGDFDERVQSLKNARYDAPKPAPFRLASENAGPVTSGVLNRGKFYKYSSLPGISGQYSDEYTNKWTDGTLLTDGEFQCGDEFVKRQYVGWKAKDPVRIVFDLGRQQQLNQVRIHAANEPEVYYYAPKDVRVRVRSERDGAWLDWDAIPAKGAECAATDGAFVMEKQGPLTPAIEVEVTLIPDDSQAPNKMLISEVELKGLIKNTWRQVPANGGVYNGAYSPAVGFDMAARGGKTDRMRIDLFEKVTGKPLSMVLWYQTMSPGRGFEEIQELRRLYLSENFYGTRLLIYGWEPSAMPLEDIAAGVYDDFFEQYFRDSIDPVVLMGMDAPVIFRPMNEFNSSWVPWGHQPELFRKAWWRIYNIAEKTGATKMHLFCWSPNHRSYPDETWNKMENYYPGDQYVDWIGVSAYPPSRQFVETDDDLYPIARCKEIYSKFGRYKPFIISEGGFGPSHVDKVRWVDEWFKLPDVYPNYCGYIWENHHNGSTDRTIQSDEKALNLYRGKVQNPRFLSTRYSE